MVHIIVGLFFILLGIWGIFDEWYYVVDCVKGGSSLALIFIGLVGLLAGFVGKPVHEDGSPDGLNREGFQEDDEGNESQEPGIDLCAEDE